MAIYYYDENGFIWSKQNGPDPKNEEWMESQGRLRIDTDTEEYLEYAKVVNGEVVHDPDAAYVGLSEQVRLERNTLLTEVDAIAGNSLRWSTLSAEQQDAWAVYRQALLDVPQQDGFPNDVTWPVKP